MIAVARVPALIILLATPAHAQVRVVNMIPGWFGGETTWNPEPTLAVNPVQPGLLAASAFLMGSSVCHGNDVSPILVSRDSGQRWAVVCKMSTPGITQLPPQDVRLRWGADGKRLYAAMIWPAQGPLQTLRVLATRDLFSPDTMEALFTRDTVDQPGVAVLGVAGRDRLFAFGSFKTLGPAAAIYRADAPRAPGDFVLTPVQRDSGNNSMRVATHPSGRVYAFYNRVAGSIGTGTSAVEFDDFVIARDDSGGASAHPFAALRDGNVPGVDTTCAPITGAVGIRVARCRPMPYDDMGSSAFGWQRRLPVLLSIAVDPTDAAGNRLYVAWGDSVGPDLSRLWVARSEDGGRTWRVLLSVPSATNPSLAVDSLGRVGFLFQQTGSGSSERRWYTRLLIGGRDFSAPQSFVLADTPARVTLLRFQPYLGDYIELHATGTSFLGVFSAANMPDSANFPNGVRFQRNADFSSGTLIIRSPPVGRLQVSSQVAPSIDPFFFMIGLVESNECAGLRAKRGTSTGRTDPAVLPSAQRDPLVRRMMQVGCRW